MESFNKWMALTRNKTQRKVLHFNPELCKLWNKAAKSEETSFTELLESVMLEKLTKEELI